MWMERAGRKEGGHVRHTPHATTRHRQQPPHPPTHPIKPQDDPGLPRLAVQGQRVRLLAQGADEVDGVDGVAQPPGVLLHLGLGMGGGGGVSAVVVCVCFSGHDS